MKKIKNSNFPNRVKIELTFLFLNLIFYSGISGAVPAPENLARGLIAYPRELGRVYLGWRLLSTDYSEEGFNIFRSMQSGGPYGSALNYAPITLTTNYLDTTTVAGNTYYYVVKNMAGVSSNEAKVTTAAYGDNYISIPAQLTSGYIKGPVVPGDLDGDGMLELVILETAYPDFFLNAYDMESKSRLWRVKLSTPDTNMAGGAGNHWWGPFTVWDMDGNGKAEVYGMAGDITGNDELVAFNGQTGAVIGRVPWLSRNYIQDFDTNFLGIAFWNGLPHIVGGRGTQYTGLKAGAFDKNLIKEWQWTAQGVEMASAGHYMNFLDADGDGNDEILWGSNLLDHSGVLKWTHAGNSGSHVDISDMGDYDPARSGIEVFYADCRTIYDSWKGKAEVYLVDWETNQKIWAKDWDPQAESGTGGKGRPLAHIHGGYVADVDPTPGTEIITWDDYGSIPNAYPLSQYPVPSHPRPMFVMDNKGNYLYWNSNWDKLAFQPPCQFDDDSTWEIVNGGNGYYQIADLYGSLLTSMHNVNAGIAVDLFGDFREEYIMFAQDNSAIYILSNIWVMSNKRKVTWLEDRVYRTGLARFGTGYTRANLPGGKGFNGGPLGSFQSKLSESPEVILTNFPNPFQTETEIHLTAEKEFSGREFVLQIVNLQGQVVRTIYQGSQKNRLYWDGKDDRNQRVNSGVYFIWLTGQNISIQKKILYIP